jgi:type VII secretion protein EccB
MATRRDQLQSYQFLNQRVISAFVMRETDPAQSPLRRGVGAIFAGIMVTVLVGAVFGVYGLLTKVGANTWKVDGSVVVEKETGATFVYQAGQLHPTLNFASALLAANHPGAAPARVSASSLSGVPRGVTIGIPDAPNSLPAASQTVGTPWTMCSSSGTDSANNQTTTVTLVVGRAPTGERPVGDQALLVKDSSTTYLLWRNHRYLLTQPSILIPALFGATVTPTPVGRAWLNGLPAGTGIGPLPVDNRGTPSSAIPDQKIGDVLEAQAGNSSSYYLVLDDGLAPITQLQKDILAAQYPVRLVPTTVSAATQAKHSSRLSQPPADVAPPQSPPKLDQSATSDLLCAKTTDADTAPQVSVGGTVSQIASAIPTTSQTAGGTTLADRVLVPPGKIAVVRAVPGPGVDTGAYYLVTDVGIRYAVPSDQALEVLGYTPGQAVAVPPNLLTRLPAGPTLDPALALQPVQPG